MDKREETRTVTIKLDGVGITPEDMGRDLLRVLTCCWDLAELSGEGRIGIQSIENNCALIKISLGASLAVLSLFGQCGSKDAIKSNKCIGELNKAMKDRGFAIEITDSMRPGYRVQYSVENLLPTLEEERDVVRQCMNIYGELTDVGGAKPNIHIRSRRQDQLIRLDIDKEDAQKIANRLYRPIGVYAEVKTIDDVVTEGKVLEVLDYDPVEPHEWVKNLPDWMGKPWKGVNLDEYMKSLREDDDEGEAQG